MNICPIDLSKYSSKRGFKVIDRFPDRKFSGEAHVLLYPKEAFGGYEHFNFFKLCDRSNIKVHAYCSSLLLPVASLVSHVAIIQDTDIYGKMYCKNSIGVFGFDRKLAWSIFGIEKKGGWTQIPSFDRGFSDVLDSFHFFISKDILMDKSAIINWENGVSDLFDPQKIFCEVKGRHYKEIWLLLNEKFSSSIMGLDRSFQKEILLKHNGNSLFLSYQILSSVLKGCRYVAFGGSANLLSSALPVRVIVFGDSWDYLSEQMVFFKNRFMKHFYSKFSPCFNSLYDSHEYNADFVSDFLSVYLEKYEPPPCVASNIKIIKSLQ